MVPLDENRTILDVMMALRLPLILVTGSYLGTISHTLTALDSLYRRDMNVLAIIVSETPGSTVPLDDTVAAIARFAEPVIGCAATAAASGWQSRRRRRLRPHVRCAGRCARATVGPSRAGPDGAGPRTAARSTPVTLATRKNAPAARFRSCLRG